MPKGSKKRAKLKKQQRQGDSNPNPSSSDYGNNNSRTTASNNNDKNHLPIQPNIPHVDVSEDSSSEEMATPRAAALEADEEEKAASAVPVKRAVEVFEEAVSDGVGAGGAGKTAEEVVVVPAAPEAGKQREEGKVEAPELQEPDTKGEEVAVVEAAGSPVMQEPEAKGEVVWVVDVTEAPALQELEVKDEEVSAVEVAEAPSVQEPEAKGEEVVVREAAAAPAVQEPEVKDEEAAVRETAETPAVQEPEVRDEERVVTEAVVASRSFGATGGHTVEEVARGPVVAVATVERRATWWNCCGLLDAFTGSGR